MRVYTHYSDGQLWITKHPYNSNTYTEIRVWQWWLYSLFVKIERGIHPWLSRLDNRAYDEFHVREGIK